MRYTQCKEKKYVFADLRKLLSPQKSLCPQIANPQKIKTLKSQKILGPKIAKPGCETLAICGPTTFANNRFEV